MLINFLRARTTSLPWTSARRIAAWRCSSGVCPPCPFAGAPCGSIDQPSVVLDQDPRRAFDRPLTFNRIHRQAATTPRRVPKARPLPLLQPAASKQSPAPPLSPNARPPALGQPKLPNPLSTTPEHMAPRITTSGGESSGEAHGDFASSTRQRAPLDPQHVKGRRVRLIRCSICLNVYKPCQTVPSLD